MNVAASGTYNHLAVGRVRLFPLDHHRRRAQWSHLHVFRGRSWFYITRQNIQQGHYPFSEKNRVKESLDSSLC
jgi:hypothetical protein